MSHACLGDFEGESNEATQAFDDCQEGRSIRNRLPLGCAFFELQAVVTIDWRDKVFILPIRVGIVVGAKRLGLVNSELRVRVDDSVGVEEEILKSNLMRRYRSCVKFDHVFIQVDVPRFKCSKSLHVIQRIGNSRVELFANLCLQNELTHCIVDFRFGLAIITVAGKLGKVDTSVNSEVKEATRYMSAIV